MDLSINNRMSRVGRNTKIIKENACWINCKTGEMKRWQ